MQADLVLTVGATVMLGLAAVVVFNVYAAAVLRRLLGEVADFRAENVERGRTLERMASAVERLRSLQGAAAGSAPVLVEVGSLGDVAGRDAATGASAAAAAAAERQTAIEQAVEPYRQQVAALRAEIDAAGVQLASANDTIRSLRHASHESEGQRQALEAANTELEAKLRKSRQRWTDAEERSAQMATRLGALERAAARREEDGADRSRLEEQLATALAEREALAQEVRELGGEIQRARLEKQFIEEHYLSLSEEAAQSGPSA